MKELNKHAPCKFASRIQKQLFLKPWITKDIFDTIYRKQKMYKTHFKSVDPHEIAKYEVCLKSNETVDAAQTTFIPEKKALLFMMSQCLMVSKTKFQHSVTTTFFFARFSVRALSLRPFCENLVKFRIFGFSSMRRMSVGQQINLKFLVRLGKLQLKH